MIPSQVAASSSSVNSRAASLATRSTGAGSNRVSLPSVGNLDRGVDPPDPVEQGEDVRKVHYRAVIAIASPCAALGATWRPSARRSAGQLPEARRADPGPHRTVGGTGVVCRHGYSSTTSDATSRQTFGNQELELLVKGATILSSFSRCLRAVRGT
jgi:hypothetical protein